MPLPVPSPRKLMRSALPTPSKPKPEPPTASTASTIPRTTAPIRPPSVRSSRPPSTLSSRPPSRSTRPPSSSSTMPPPPSTSRPRNPPSASTSSLRSTASTDTTATREKKSSSFSPAKLLRRATGRSKESLTDKDNGKTPKEPARGGSLRMPSKPAASSGGMFGLGRSASSKTAKSSAKEIPAPASAAAARARPTSMQIPTAKSGIAVPSAGGSRLGHRRGGSVTSTGSPPAKELKKPAFSTLQRDYNAAPPAKPKPSSIPPPALDPATVVAQTKLLQHACLYIHSGETYRQLTLSAHGKLRSRFHSLAEKHKATTQQLAHKQKGANFRGIAAVLEAPAAGVISGSRRDTIRGPEEKIQAFSEAVKTLETLASNEHAALTATFSSWIEGYTPPPTGMGEGWMQGRERWLDGLGRGWREECARVMRRVEGCVRDVEGVVAVVVGLQGKGEDAGVLGVVAERWLDVGRGLGEECNGMVVVEERVVERERGALKDAVAKVGVQVTVEGEGGTGVGVWSR